MPNNLYILSSATVKEGIFTEFGRIAPCFVPIDNVTLIEKITEQYKVQFKNIKLTISADYELAQSEIDLLDKLNVEKIIVKEGQSIDAIIFLAINHWLEDDVSHRDISLAFGDTLINGYDFSLNNSFSSHSASTSQSWTYVQNMADKVFSGYLTLDKKIATKVIQGSFGKNVISQSTLIQNLVPNESGEWLDTGHISEYIQARSHFDTSRTFNNLLITKHTVCKKSENKDKINAEAEWFKELPKSLKKYIPQLIDHQYEAGHYTIEKLPLIPLSEIYIYGKQEHRYWDHLFLNISTLLSEFSLHKKPNTDFNYSKWLKTKTAKRITEFTDDLQILLAAELVINDKKYDSLISILDNLERINYPLDLLDHTSLTVVHGDLCLSNIFFDQRLNLIKLIDPRGAFDNNTVYGPQSYDFVKLAHSILKNYDYIISGKYYIKQEGQIFSYNVNVNENKSQVVDIFKEKILQQNEINLHTLHLNLFHLFISMIPLHRDNPMRQRAFLIEALEAAESAGIC